MDLKLGQSSPISLKFLNNGGIKLLLGTSGAGSTTWTGLLDTPEEIEALKFVRGNADGDSLEFVESSTSVAWGVITGTLSNQADLQAALDLKYDAADFNVDFSTQFGLKTTTNLTEGTNLYYTDVRVSANSDVSSNTSKRHDPATVSDSVSINLTLSGQDITADVLPVGVDHNLLLNYQVSQHRVINDSGTSLIELWSANKISSELALKGDVNGPTSSTDNAIATYDGTTGKLIKDSGLIVENQKIYQSGFPNSYIKFNDGAIEIWVDGQIQIGWN